MKKQLSLFLKHFIKPGSQSEAQELSLKVQDMDLIPITNFVAQDIFIVGYPKSGNSWFQSLVVGALYGIDIEHSSDQLIQELLPDVHYNKFYKRHGNPMFFRSHNLPKPEYKQVVYLLRDGRDVMVSYFHHLKALQNKEINFLKMVQNGKEFFPCKWHQHVKTWLSNPFDAQMIIIRYEDLIRDTLKELNRFCKFIEVEVDKFQLQQAILQCSFENMREKEENQGWDNPSWPKDKSFVRRGQVGSYRDEMPSDALEVFMKEAGETLIECGYENK